MNDLYKKYVRLSCRYASQLLVKRAEAVLTPAESARLWWHLRLCDPCARFSRQAQLIDRLLTRHLTDQLPPVAPALRPERRAAMTEAIKKQLKPE